MNTANEPGDRSFRREFLRLAVLAGVGGLAGCLSEETDDPVGEDSIEDRVDDDSDGDGPIDDAIHEENENPPLRAVLVWDPSYVMELSGPLGSGTITVHDGDSHTDWVVDGQAMEAYRIGSQEYVVVDGECFVAVGSSEDEIFEPDALIHSAVDIVAEGTTTIEGRVAYRFDVDDGTLYVDIETGYPLRFEGTESDTVVTFHSWGATAPIVPPEMDCVEQ